MFINIFSKYISPTIAGIANKMYFPGNDHPYFSE